LRNHLPTAKTRVAAIYRHNQAIIPHGDTVIEPDDEVFFVAAHDDIRGVMSELRLVEQPGNRIMLAGAGNIGLRLAQALEKSHYQVKLIESNRARAYQAAALLGESIVLHGNAADEELMTQENIENTEAFCSITNEDEANILSAMLAKRLGARRTMALVNRSAYVDLVETRMLDIAISPKISTVGILLTHIRRADTVTVHSLRRGAAEVIEIIAHGEPSSSRVVGRRIDEIQFPPGTTLSVILRNEEVITARKDTVIEPEDHVIVFVIDKQHIPDVEKLFQVSVTYV
jgi:trk system potassium uptake protein TrkA